MLSLVERGRAAMRRLEEILETNPEITDEAASPAIHALKRSASKFRNVSSLMSGRKTAIGARRNQLHAPVVARLVGWARRSGKSPLAQFGATDVSMSSTGAILIDGRDSRTLSVARI